MTGPGEGRAAGKVVLVTGAGRGMGRSHALRLAEEGADVILVDLCAPVEGISYPMSTKDDLAETAAAVEALDRRASVHVADTRDAEALRAAVDDGVAQLGGLDAAVANAGVITAGPWNTVTPQHWRAVVDVNLIGTWNTCAAAIPHLLERGGGSLINISSAAGVKGMPLTTPYTASKYGVTGLTQALANELAASSIRVNSVHPGGVQPSGMNVPELHDLLAGPRADLGAIYQHALPIEMLETTDISNAILFLVSDESRYVTGLQFKVDAGMTMS